MNAVDRRFLAPRHVATDIDIEQCQADAEQDTPGTQATCRLFVRRQADGGLHVRFRVFGPPTVIAAADWLCEQVEHAAPADTQAITSSDVATALALAPAERHVGVLVVDVLASALSNLGS